MSDLKKSAYKGIKWSYISTISTSVFQLLYTSIMARLLLPEAFGLVAMGTIILRFGNYFAQMGMGQALIQKEDLEEYHINSSFTFSILLGIVFFCANYALSPYIADVFNSPALIDVVRVMGFSFIVNSLLITSSSLLRRRLEFKKLAIAEVASYFSGYIVVGIGLAYFGYGVWSLVIASLSQASLLSLFTYLFGRHSLRLNFNWRNYKSLLSFGSKVSLISFLEFIGANLDSILIGKFLGSAKLGIYNRASMLINIPLQNLTNSFSKVLYPLYSRLQNDIERLKKSISEILFLFAFFLLQISCFMSVLSDEVIYVVLGPKWSAAGRILAVLAFSASLDFIKHLVAVTFESVGILKTKIAIQLINIILLLALIYLFRDWGLMGFAAAILCVQINRVGMYFYFMKYRFKMELSYFFIYIKLLLYLAVSVSILYVSRAAVLSVTSNVYIIISAVSIVFAVIIFIECKKIPYLNGIILKYFDFLENNKFGKKFIALLK